jgi:hypothetical protein
MIAVPVVLKCSRCLPKVPETKIADTSSLSRKTVSAHLDHIDGQVGASPTGPSATLFVMGQGITKLTDS